jgi:hypothetical protein
MINPKQRARLQRAINRLVKAEVERSWRGAYNRHDNEEIVAECRNAKANLKQVLDALTVREQTRSFSTSFN